MHIHQYYHRNDSIALQDTSLSQILEHLVIYTMTYIDNYYKPKDVSLLLHEVLKFYVGDNSNAKQIIESNINFELALFVKSVEKKLAVDCQRFFLKKDFQIKLNYSDISFSSTEQKLS